MNRSQSVQGMLVMFISNNNSVADESTGVSAVKICWLYIISNKNRCGRWFINSQCGQDMLVLFFLITICVAGELPRFSVVKIC